MPLVSDIIPSLTGGVSQQPASARVPGKAEVADNALFSLLEGTNKRPPTEYVARLFNYSEGDNPDAADKPLIRVVHRDEDTRYMVWIQDGVIRCFDVEDGTEATVTMDPDTEDYIATANPRDDLDLLTVGDTSFVWNRGVEVENVSDASAAATYDALIYVRSGTYGRKYSVTVNGTEYYFHTPDGSSAWNTVVTDPSFIAFTLVNGFDTPPTSYGLPSTWATDYDLAGDYCKTSATNLEDLGGGFTVTLRGSLIRIQSATPFDIRVDDGQGGDGMSVAYGTVARLSDLPSQAFDGFLVKVGKTTAESDSDYYLQFDDPDDDGVGVWTETLGPGTNLGVDAATLPHRLVRNADGTFTFSQVPYNERTVGTEDTAPDPTFVGRNVNAVAYLFDRLCFLSGEDWHFSAARDLYRFYRSTLITKADDDPFAITASAAGVSIMRHVVQANGAVIGFAAQRQFQLERTSERFAALGAQLIDTQAYEAAPLCKPKEAGASVYFTADRKDYATFREYRPTSFTQATVSDEIGADIPRYVPAGVHTIAVSGTEQTLVALTDTTTDTLYVYRWADIDGRRLMSAWAKWNISEDFNVLGADFVGSKLFVCIDSPGFGVDLEVIDLSPGVVDTDSTFKVRLDSLVVSPEMEYDEGLGATIITLPYEADTALRVLARTSEDFIPLTLYDVEDIDGNTLTVEGDITALPVFVGRPYRFQYTFSPFFVREDSGTQSGAPVRDGRLQVADVAVEIVPPYYVESVVTNEGRTPWRKDFTGYTSELLDSELVTNAGKAAFVRFTVAAQNTRTKIDLINETHLPCQILSAQWRGQFNPRSRSL